MKTLGFILVFVLSVAGLAQAVNTVATLNDTTWAPSQKGLGGDIGPGDEDVADLQGQTPEAPASPDSMLGPILEDPLDLYAVPEENSTSGSYGNVAQVAGGSIRSADGTGIWYNLPRWDAEPGSNAGAEFVKANSGESLPVLAEIDWMSVSLPVETETSLMEIVVFPTLGVAVFIFFAGMLVVRFRRRKAASQVQQLLQV